MFASKYIKINEGNFWTGIENVGSKFYCQPWWSVPNKDERAKSV